VTTSEQINEIAGALAKAQGENDAHAEAALIRAFVPVPRTNQKAASLGAALFARIAFGMTDCWHWTGALNHLGYGLFASARKYYGCPEIHAHRISWWVHNGPIPGGLRVLHRCDVRSCVNPSHLFLGTQADNVADMVAKGRNRTVSLGGERNGMARLTFRQVEAMRAAFAGGESQRSIALRFGVSAMTAHRALRGKSWRTE
jgi:hypothetical protein